MKIGLADIDGHGFPNIALMKVSQFHKDKGDQVDLAILGHYDILYKSKLFDFSKDLNSSLITADKIIQGGSGYDLKTQLPNEIDICEPDYSIYPYDFSLQFYSRGCIRNCPFCIVRQKEGYIRTVEPMRLNPKGKHIEVLDNNFFANPDWAYAINDLMNTGQKVNFHGVDVRIMDERHAYWLNRLKHHKQIHIAWDNPREDIIPNLKEITKRIKPYKIMCYVLIGYWSTPEEDLYRVEKLREFGITPFVMPFNKSDKYQKRFARWVNHVAIFKTVKWENYR